jgi:hypothetical protein
MAVTTNGIDIITIANYYTYLEQDYPSPTTDKEDAIQQAITDASSYMEQTANRPFTTSSAIDIPTDDDGDEIAFYQPYNAPVGNATPSKTMLPELQRCCYLIAQHFRHLSEHMHIAGTSTATKTKNYDNLIPHIAYEILKRHTYHEELNMPDDTR